MAVFSVGVVVVFGASEALFQQRGGRQPALSPPVPQCLTPPRLGFLQQDRLPLTRQRQGFLHRAWLPMSNKKPNNHPRIRTAASSVLIASMGRGVPNGAEKCSLPLIPFVWAPGRDCRGEIYRTRAIFYYFRA